MFDDDFREDFREHRRDFDRTVRRIERLQAAWFFFVIALMSATALGVAFIAYKLLAFFGVL